MVEKQSSTKQSGSVNTLVTAKDFEDSLLVLIVPYSTCVPQVLKLRLHAVLTTCLRLTR